MNDLTLRLPPVLLLASGAAALLTAAVLDAQSGLAAAQQMFLLLASGCLLAAAAWHAPLRVPAVVLGLAATGSLVAAWAFSAGPGPSVPMLAWEVLQLALLAAAAATLAAVQRAEARWEGAVVPSRQEG